MFLVLKTWDVTWWLSFRREKKRLGAWFVRGRSFSVISLGISNSLFLFLLLIFSFSLAFFICGRVSQGLQVGSPFFHFKYVELWNQGKGKFFQILGVYTCGCNGYAFNFYVVECCVFFVFASVDATGIIMFVICYFGCQIGFFDPKNLVKHIKFVEFGFV